MQNKSQKVGSYPMNAQQPTRIAMWSGPRNISTAMMRAFENRADCAVWDEPFYGPFLAQTGKPHPLAAEIIADQGDDWQAVIDGVCGPAPDDKPLFYQKHMTHHMLPDLPLDWMDKLTNCFLIRDPAEVLTSYQVKRSEFDASDLGFPQQLRLFNHVTERSGRIPVVIEGKAILKNPRKALSVLCTAINIPFDEDMLNWPVGVRDTDGVWGKHWYDRVWLSSGFSAFEPKVISLSTEQQIMVDECRPSFETLYEHRLIV